MITVRVSEDEYQTLHSTARTMGYRSLSDLTRAAMHNITGVPDPVSSRLETFAARLARLEAALTEKPHAQ